MSSTSYIDLCCGVGFRYLLQLVRVLVCDRITSADGVRIGRMMGLLAQKRVELAGYRQ